MALKKKTQDFFFTFFSDFISIFETFFRSGKLLKIDALYDPWVLYKVVHSITCTCTPPYREVLRVQSGMDFDFRHYPDLDSTSDWWKQIFNQSEVLPRSGYWHVISMEFQRSFLRRHFEGKPVVASRNVGCFLRLSWVIYQWKCHIWCACHGRKAVRTRDRN